MDTRILLAFVCAVLIVAIIFGFQRYQDQQKEAALKEFLALDPTIPVSVWYLVPEVGGKVRQYGATVGGLQKDITKDQAGYYLDLFRNATPDNGVVIVKELQGKETKSLAFRLEKDLGPQWDKIPTFTWDQVRAKFDEQSAFLDSILAHIASANHSLDQVKASLSQIQ